MIAPTTLQRLAYAALFAGLAALVVFLRLLPTGSDPGAWPPPDLIVLAGFAWVIRRPDYVPVVLFAALLLVNELMVLRPPGLGAALGVLALEALRARSAALQQRGFLSEWTAVAVALALIALGERLLLSAAFVDPPPLALAALGLAVNIVAYPGVAALSIWGFKVRRLAPGDHRRGHRREGRRT